MLALGLTVIGVDNHIVRPVQPIPEFILLDGVRTVNPRFAAAAKNAPITVDTATPPPSPTDSQSTQAQA